MIAGWFVKLVVAFVIAGVVIYDGASMVTNFFTLDSKANEIAVDLSTAIASRELSANQRFQLEKRAEEQAEGSGARLVKVEVDREGKITVRLRRRANTLVVGRIGPIKDWTKATADATSSTS